jgi:serine/threonine protein kinase
MRPRSDLGANFLSGEVPASLGNATALRELRLDGNLLTGALPPSLGALSGLQTMCVARRAAPRGAHPRRALRARRRPRVPLWLRPLPGTWWDRERRGRIPPARAARAARALTPRRAPPPALPARSALDGNRLNGSAAVPASLCGAACAADAAFACPFSAAATGCGCAPARCAPLDACAPAPGRAPHASAVAAACVSPLLGCYDCQSALFASLLSAGTPLPDAPTIAACLPAATPAFLAAGASPAALAAQRTCAFPSRAASNFSCPVTLPPSAFAPAVAPCATLIYVCSTCSATFVDILIAAGLRVPPLGLAFTTAHYETVANCLAKHALPILAAGVSQNTFLWGFGICYGPTPEWFAGLAAATPPPPLPPAPPPARFVPAPLPGGGSSGDGSGSDGAATAGGAAAGAVGGFLLLAGAAAGVVTLRRRRAAAAACAPPGDAEAGLHARAHGYGSSYGSGGAGSGSDATAAMSQQSGWRASAGAMPLLRREELQIGDCIGSGGFAQVHRARWCGTEVAVKLFERELVWAPGGNPRGGSRLAGNAAASFASPSPLPSAPAPPSSSSSSAASLRLDEAGLLREMRVLQNLRHPNVCAVYGLVTSPPMLVIELAPAGSLLDVLHRSSAASLPWRARVGIGAGVAAGVEYLHSQAPPIIHSDLKSANVVLSDSLMPKLCDFGLSRVLPTLGVGPPAGVGPVDAGSGGMVMQVGTPQYMAPEVVLAAPITLPTAIDAYGLGVVLHDLIHLGIFAAGGPQAAGLPRAGGGGRAASGVTGGGSGVGNAVHVFYTRAAAAFRVELAAHAPEALASLTRRCLAVAPEERPSSGEVRGQLLALADAADGWAWPAGAAA